MARGARRLIFLLTLLIAAGGIWPGLVGPRADETLNAKTTATIKAARTQIIAGEFAQAVRNLRSTIENERVPPELQAQGFLYRGIARLQLGQTGYALSDFKNAFWLDKLPDRLRAQGHVYRARAYDSVGENEKANADLKEAMRLAPDDPMVIAAALASGISPPQAAELPTGAIPRTGSSRASGVAESGYAIQLGALADIASAQAEWRRISGLHGDLLTGLEPRYEDISSSGRRLVRIRTGPLATSDAANGLCARLRARGQDCFAVGQ